MPKKTTKETPEAPAKEKAPKASAALPTDKKKAQAIPGAGKTDAKKLSVIKKFQNHDGDTGSSEVQVAVLTEKISRLSQHLAEHKQDNDSRSGLLKMISHRRSLLGYLEKRHPDQYRKVIASLGLRK